MALIASYLGSKWLMPVVLGGLVGLVLLVGAAVIYHKGEAAATASLEKKYADAEAKAAAQSRAIQKAEDAVSMAAAVAEANAQQKIVTVTNTVIREVPSHVPLVSKCPVTVGFVRVLNAAILGGSSADVSYAAGQPDDACAPTDPRTLAANILNNYAAALSNAEQLGALQGWVRKTIAASKGTTK